MERLDKLISSQRADGRKEVQKLIKSGAVLVNGKICKKPDTKVDPDKDEIVVDGQALNYSKYIYIMMNKPAGVVSATEDRQFKTVIDIIPEDMKRKGLFPVGRLDRDTEGLLLITDDGDFAHSITSPKKHVDKKYVAKLDGEITEDTVKAFSDGIEFSDGTKCRSAVLECDENDKKTGIVTICEGKYHQVKKMFLCCGLKVVHLQRISIGGLYLDSNLHIGECKLLTDMKRKGLFPVGRLDRDTEGLLLITDDGDFAHSITSPKKHVDKKYVAKLDGEITEDTVKAFSDGIEFSDGTKCRSAVLECDENDKKTGIVTICEGKYHQVKKMFLCCGLKVVHLQRISIGGLYLDSNLHIGECKLLTDLDKKSVFIGNIH